MMNKLTTMTLCSRIRVHTLDCSDANFDTCLWFAEGTLEGGINYKGLQYYKNLINTLKENGDNII